MRLRGRVVDLDRGRVEVEDGEPEQLTSRELALLRYLHDRAGITVARETLLQEVWEYSDQVLSRACDNAVRRIRQKLERDPAHPHHILTVRGEGYRFQPLVDAPTPEPPSPDAPTRVLRLGDRTVDVARHVVQVVDGDSTAITAQEAQLLQLLWDANGAVVSRTALVRAVWGHAAGRALDHAVRRLRTKIEPTPAAPRYLETIRGAGFRLVVPGTPTLDDAAATFIGRARELAELRGLLQPGRWVLVVGPGGMGKTRLTRRALAGQSGPPTWWASLASATSVAMLVASLAEVLGLVLSGTDEPEQRVALELARAGRGVVVLDNLEQLGPAAGPVIDRWRAAAPELCFVGTSRIRLGLVDEVALELPPLTTEQGVALYEARASEAWRDYRMRGAEGSAAAGVVERLGGLPLAIELAAARAAVLPAVSLLPRLDRALELLVRPHDEGARHHSLRATFDLSYGLLEEEHAGALQLLGLFSQPFGVGDVEGLLGAGGVETLQALRDHHLLHARHDTHPPRFEVYEPLRAYLHELREADPGRARECALAWARWMARLGDPAWLDALRVGVDDASWEVQRDASVDLAAAAKLALRFDEPATALRCVCAGIAGTVHHHPQATWLTLAERVSDTAVPVDEAARLDAWVAVLLLYLDRADEALPVAERGAARASSPLIEALCWSAAAKVPQRSGGGGEAPAYRRAAAAFERAGEPARAAFCEGRSQLASGEVEAGRRALVLAERQAAADRETLTQAHALRELGCLDAAAGRAAAAEERFEAALAMFEASDRVASAYAVLYFLQDLTWWTGQTAAFDDATARALEACRRRGSGVETACSMALAAGQALATGALTTAELRMADARVALRAQAHHEPSRVALLDWVEAELSLAAGRPTEAVRLAGRARAVLEALQIPVSGAIGSTEAAGLTDREAARALASDSVASLGTGAPPAYRAFGLARRGLLALDHGESEVARQALERARQSARDAAADAPTGWAGRLVHALAERIHD